MIPGLSSLANTQVVLWADGKDQGQLLNNGNPFTVSAGGTLTLPGGATVSSGVVGLAYTAQFQSSKLAQAIQGESGLLRRKSIARIGLVLDSTHAQGLAYGKDFASLDSLPPIEDDTTVDPTSQWTAYDKDSFAFDGSWDTDARVCLQAAAPRNVTVLACVIEMDQS